MKVAFSSPLPPAKSGIADYSAALLDPLQSIAEVEVFSGPEKPFDPARFDIALYQVGNNACHSFVYETALRHPGVVVMHEANLHHLIADITIRRGDWDAYLREAEFEGGSEALTHARRVQALETGPDYEDLPMLRRLLGASRAAIVHSRHVEGELQRAGLTAPVAVIPHGAWIPRADRHAWRNRLGLDETTPLVGVFGFLKPYKRIAESMRAMRRLLRVEPRARMILVGEEHPDLPLRPMIQSLGLAASVRVLGFTPIEDFVGYIAACDVVLNLRYPTVGETSGSLLRALGLGKATLVSDVGAFAELPDEVCVKVAPGAGEEDLIFEYLNLLVSRPGVARALGERARAWVERECAWPLVARRYAAFLEAVAAGRQYEEPRAEALPPAAAGPVERAAEYVAGWAENEEAKQYIATHVSRLEKTLEITPRGATGDRVLEMGAYLQITPALREKLGYEEVRGCYYGPPGETDHKEVISASGEKFTCDIDLFDAEQHRFPYPDGYFATVLCCELIEHLRQDPMHLMSEVNRILKPGGHLVLTTPNIASLRGLEAILQGYHPGFFHAYLKPTGNGDARHNREYAPREIHQLFESAGFAVTLLETGPFREEPRPEQGWVEHLLEHYGLPGTLRGEGIYAVGRKAGPVRDRYPSWLYA